MSARRWAIVALAILAIAGVIAWMRSAAPEESSTPAVEEPQATHGEPLASPLARAVKVAPDAPRVAGETRGDRRERLERAKELLEHYRESTRYPPNSRPLTENPDRMHLHEPAERTRALDRGSDTQVTVGQDRTFVAATDTARLWVRCATETGASVPCRVTSASVEVVNEDDQPPVDRHAPVSFQDDGQGTWTALVQPKALGLGDVTGTLQVNLEVTDSRDVGHPFFTLVATGEAPALFTRAVSEKLVDGSLELGVGINVKSPGRYVITGRVDDAHGQPFAYVEFNDELAAGAQSAKLQVFGRLVRDQHPAFPLVLRDVEGFLLLEDASPDRRILAPMEGPVLRTQVYPESAFSDAEWQSEERQRYLTEYQHDVDAAQAALDAPP